jgi:hypothetical protein
VKQAAILAAVALAGCSTPRPPEPIIRTVEVRVPVMVRCEPHLTPAPAYPDDAASLRAAPDVFRAAQLVMAGRVLRDARITELQAALEACSH